MDGIVELRQYTLHPGTRDTLTELFEREFVGGQEAAGVTLGGRYRDLDDPDRFVWLRGFPGMAARDRALRAFYEGPVWRAHRDAANATMIDSDDVRLLRGPCFGGAPGEGGAVVVTLCLPREAGAGAGAGFGGYFEASLGPALRVAGFPPRAVHRTEHAVNTFPALPVREGEEVFLWFTPGATPPPLPDLSAHLRSAPRHLRLEPVGRGPA